MNSLSSMAEEVKAIKLSAPKNTPSEENPKLQEALNNANRLTQAYGVHSSEAKVAWEIVEEIASSGRTNNAVGGILTPEECLVDAAIDACEALEELNRVLNLQDAPKAGNSIRL